MVQNYIVILTLAIAVLASTSEGGVFPKENNLTFLGTLTKACLTKTENSCGTHQTSNYFQSQNAAGWSTAANDCKANLGETASLANIETDKEFQDLNDLLENTDDTGATYWLAGKYEGSDFVWGNGLRFASSAPWDKDYPNTRTPLTRVLTARVGGLLKLRTAFATVSLRYICEVPA